MVINLAEQFRRWNEPTISELRKQIKEYQKSIKEHQLQISYDKYAIKKIREMIQNKKRK